MREVLAQCEVDMARPLIIGNAVDLDELEARVREADGDFDGAGVLRRAADNDRAYRAAVDAWQRRNGITLRGLRWKINSDERKYAGVPIEWLDSGSIHHDYLGEEEKWFSRETLEMFRRRAAESPRVFVLELSADDPYIAVERFSVRSSEAAYRLQQLGFREVDEGEDARIQEQHVQRHRLEADPD